MQQPNYYSRPAARPHEPGTITGRRGPAEGFTRMAIVAVVSAVIAYMFVTVMRDYDAATYRGPTQGDGWQNRNHTGITPYGYPADNAGPPRGRQDCTYDGRKLSCGPRQGAGNRSTVNMRLDPNEVDPIEDRRGSAPGGRSGDLSQQLGPPPWGDQGGRYAPFPPPPTTSGAGPQFHRPPRWRYCDGPPDRPQRCTAWQEGPDPNEEGPHAWGRR